MAMLKGNPKKKKSGSQSQFPGKLHNMMQHVEREGLEFTISWVLNGRGFMIHNPDNLVNILPLFFGQTKYRSFRRQLNMWHFERILEGPNKGAFMHPYFVRDNRELCSCMSRQVFIKPRKADLDIDVDNNDSSSEDVFMSSNNSHHNIKNKSMDSHSQLPQPARRSSIRMHPMQAFGSIKNQTDQSIASGVWSSEDLTPFSLESFDQKNELQLTSTDLSDWLQNRTPVALDTDKTLPAYTAEEEELPSADALINYFDGTDLALNLDDQALTEFEKSLPHL